jgi:hypothetical protein
LHFLQYHLAEVHRETMAEKQRGSWADGIHPEDLERSWAAHCSAFGEAQPVSVGVSPPLCRQALTVGSEATGAAIRSGMDSSLDTPVHATESRIVENFRSGAVLIAEDEEVLRKCVA